MGLLGFIARSDFKSQYSSPLGKVRVAGSQLFAFFIVDGTLFPGGWSILVDLYKVECRANYPMLKNIVRMVFRATTMGFRK